MFTSHYGLLDLPSRLTATLYIRGSGSFVASATAPIASGWSEPVPGREFQPAVDQRLITAHRQALAREQYNRNFTAAFQLEHPDSSTSGLMEPALDQNVARGRVENFTKANLSTVTRQMRDNGMDAPEFERLQELFS